MMYIPGCSRRTSQHILQLLAACETAEICHQLLMLGLEFAIYAQGFGLRSVHAKEDLAQRVGTQIRFRNSKNRTCPLLWNLAVNTALWLWYISHHAKATLKNAVIV
jgi:hypothetical protein